MKINDYQDEARKTAKYPSDNGMGVVYTALGLGGEAGEVQNQAKKIIRDDAMLVTAERREKMADELGDVLWYVATLAYELGFTLDHIAERNLAKLGDRAKRNVISGSGDNR